MLFGDGPKGNKFANAGVGEDNVDSPLHLRDGLVKAIKVSQLGDVSLNSRDVGPDCPHGLVESFWRRPVIKIYAPSLANSFAVANPIPSVPPVIRAILSLSLLDISFSVEPRSVLTKRLWVIGC